MNKWPARLSTPVLPADNVAMSFWQSRAKLRDAPQLVDIRALARRIRA